MSDLAFKLNHTAMHLEVTVVSDAEVANLLRQAASQIKSDGERKTELEGALRGLLEPYADLSDKGAAEHVKAHDSDTARAIIAARLALSPDGGKGLEASWTSGERSAAEGTDSLPLSGLVRAARAIIRDADAASTVEPHWSEDALVSRGLVEALADAVNALTSQMGRAPSAATESDQAHDDPLQSTGEAE